MTTLTFRSVISVATESGSPHSTPGAILSFAPYPMLELSPQRDGSLVVGRQKSGAHDAVARMFSNRTRRSFGVAEMLVGGLTVSS